MPGAKLNFRYRRWKGQPFTVSQTLLPEVESGDRTAFEGWPSAWLLCHSLGSTRNALVKGRSALL